MSRREQDQDYKPKRTTIRPSRSSKRVKPVDPTDYSEVEQEESDTDSELTLLGSESGFGSEIKSEIGVEQGTIDSY